jgi:hypothetical protein
MRRKVLAALLLGGLVAGALLPAGTAAAKPGPLVVGTDPEGDWGAAVAPEAAPVGAGLGQDLVEASIAMADKTTVNFVIKVTELPPVGGTPEATRYTWNFTVNKELLEIDGKFTNYTRGTCDPTAATCPPPRDPGMQPFFVRGNCGPNDLVVTTFTACEEFAKVQAIFDVAEGTITVPVPLAAIKAKPGSKIIPGTNLFGGTVSAAPSAFLTSSAMPLDTMVVTKTFAIPRK